MPAGCQVNDNRSCAVLFSSPCVALALCLKKEKGHLHSPSCLILCHSDVCFHSHTVAAANLDHSTDRRPRYAKTNVTRYNTDATQQQRHNTNTKQTHTRTGEDDDDGEHTPTPNTPTENRTARQLKNLKKRRRQQQQGTRPKGRPSGLA